jgi:hypothetical protein
MKKNLCLTREGLGLELEICAALQQLREVKLSMQLANAHGWRIMIVWETVSERVLKMEDDLRPMIYTTHGRRYNFFHELVVEDLRLAGLESDSTDREFSKLATTCYERRNWVCGVRNERRRHSTELLRALRTEGVATAESEG